jgi:monoamine oxidase
MTRRQFLQRFGAVGGSSLVFGTMDAWALMGTPAGRRPVLSGSPGETRVLILGAGVTGLSAGYELRKLGYDLRILEARDRVGGVCHSVRRGTQETELTGEQQVCEFDEGLYFNAGPWRIPNNHGAVLDYCKELSVPLQIFVNEHDDSYLYYEGESYGELSGKRVRLREIKADMRGHTAELLAKAISQEQLDVPLSDDDVELFVRYLVGEGYLSSPDNVYVGSEARGDGSPWGLTALLRSGFANRVRSVEGGRNRMPWFQPVGGMDQIPMAFARSLGDLVTLGAAVESIRQTEDGVRVVYQDTRTGQKHEQVADYVVSCMPLSVLRTLDVDLSPAMADVVDTINYSSSAKIGIQMKRRFWEEDEGIFGGMAYTNLPIGQFSYPSNDYFTQKGVLLGFYGNGEIGSLTDKSIAERIEHVVTQTSKFHPQIGEEFETGYAAFWRNIKYSRGAYAGNPGARLAQLSEPDGRLYLGCAAVGTSPAWLEGAFGAAWGTVERLHKRVMAG